MAGPLLEIAVTEKVREIARRTSLNMPPPDRNDTEYLLSILGLLANGSGLPALAKAASVAPRRKRCGTCNAVGCGDCDHKGYVRRDG